MRWSVLVSLHVVLFSCGGGGGGGGSGSPAPTPPKLRPAGAPDIAVISVSGRCDPRSACVSPDQNTAYLGYIGGAAEAVERLFQNLGNTTLHADFISSFYSFDDDRDGKADRHGFLQLVDSLRWTFDNWVAGFDNPTRIVIVAHSHGCVWAHMATSVVPQVPIDYLISLDGNCLFWETDYGPDINDYFSQYGNPFAWDIRDPCDTWTIPGLAELQDTEDVVMPGVGVNLEVRSADPLLVRDWQLNHRLDGSRSRVMTYDARFDNHERVHDPAGESMPQILAQLGWLEQQSIQPLR